jgi:hypothetical protein
MGQHVEEWVDEGDESTEKRGTYRAFGGAVVKVGKPGAVAVCRLASDRDAL